MSFDSSKNKMATDLEVQDDGPYQSEGELGVPVDDVLSPDVDELDLLVAEEVESHLDVLQHVEPHTASFARLEGWKMLIRYFFGYSKCYKRAATLSVLSTLRL